MKTAFISYATKDIEKACAIKDLIELNGVPCWMAPDDIVPGREYAEEIIRGIESTQVTILLLSEHANASSFVKREIERAVSKNKPIFTVRLADVQPSPAMELFISSAHWIDAWQPPLKAKIDLLAASIKKITMGREESPPPPIATGPLVTETKPEPSRSIWKYVAVCAVVIPLIAFWGVNYSSKNVPVEATTEPAVIPPTSPAATVEKPIAKIAPAPAPVPDRPAPQTVETQKPEAPAPIAKPNATKKPGTDEPQKRTEQASKKTPNSSQDSRQCSSILLRASLGETLSPEEQTLLKGRCS